MTFYWDPLSERFMSQTESGENKVYIYIYIILLVVLLEVPSRWHGHVHAWQGQQALSPSPTDEPIVWNSIHKPGALSPWMFSFTGFSFIHLYNNFASKLRLYLYISITHLWLFFLCSGQIYSLMAQGLFQSAYPASHPQQQVFLYDTHMQVFETL